jgi:hypothetical protein
MSLVASHETTRPVSRGELIWTLATMLALLAILNIAAHRWVYASPATLEEHLTSGKWSLLASHSDSVDWLVLGDSTGNQGFRGDVLARDHGLSSLNLCTIGNWQTLDDQWMLQEYLERHPPPSVVLLLHVYDMWWRRPTVAEQTPIHVPRPWIFERASRDAWHRFGLYGQAYLPLWSRNRTLKRLLFGKGRPHLYPLAADGFMAVAEANPKAVAADVAFHQKWTTDQPAFAMSDTARGPLQVMVALAERNGFDLVLADGATASTLATVKSWRTYRDQVDAELASVASSSERVHRISRVFEFEPGEMTNADHLVADAAKRYTRQLAADVIARTRRR